MTRILVTGASGRIGLPLVRELISGGHAVRALVIPGDPRKEACVDTGAEVLMGSIADTDACRAAVDGIEAVYHLAGQLPQNASDGAIFETNVHGTWNLMAAAADAGPSIRHVVFASTDDVYSSVDPRYVPIDENHPRRPVSTYGLSKVLGEEIAHFYRIRRGLPVTIARFGLTQLAHELLDGITAPYFLLSARVRVMEQAMDEEDQPSYRALREKLEADGEHVIALYGADDRPWILQICEVSDLVKGLARFVDQPSAIGETFNMGGPTPFASNVAADHLAAITGLPVLRVNMPGPALVIDESIARARSFVGYDPQLTIFRILDQAVSEVQLARSA